MNHTSREILGRMYSKCCKISLSVASKNDVLIISLNLQRELFVKNIYKDKN